MDREAKLNWRENPHAAKAVLDAIRGDMRSNRRPDDDPHMTELIYCLTKSWFGRYSSDMPSIDVMPTDQEVQIFALGIGLESILLKPQKQHISGVTEGISWEIDAVMGMGEGNDGEMKTTRLSSKNFPWKTDSKTKVTEYNMPLGWEKQVLGYRKVREIPDLQPTEFIVWHLMGNYGPPFPEVKVFELTAKPGAVEENWAWLKWRRDIYNEFRAQGRPPTPFQYNMPYECDGCRLKLVCDATVYAQKQGLAP